MFTSDADESKTVKAHFHDFYSMQVVWAGSAPEAGQLETTLISAFGTDSRNANTLPGGEQAATAGCHMFVYVVFNNLQQGCALGRKRMLANK